MVSASDGEVGVRDAGVVKERETTVIRRVALVLIASAVVLACVLSDGRLSW